MKDVTQTTDLHKDWGDLAAYVEAGSPIGRPAALEIFYRLRAAYDKPDPQMAKDAQELAHNTVEEWKHSTAHDIYKHDLQRLKEEIQAALTAAEQRGYERGKADVVPSGDAEETINLISLVEYFDKRPDHKEWAVQELQKLVAAARAEGERVGFERAIPDGWQRVPKELTDSMIEEARHIADGPGVEFQEHWDYMLAVAPSPASEP